MSHELQSKNRSVYNLRFFRIVFPLWKGTSATLPTTMKYALIIDAGSSGSWALVYQYTNDSTTVLPQIQQISNTKTKPGLSTYGYLKKGSYDLWGDHFATLIETAKGIIPANLHSITPVFVQATAGMRLLPSKSRDRILKQVCDVISKESEFVVLPCEEHIEVIDGDTEGLYGWLALNYLSGKLEDVNSIPYGFMDMGGASTQLAFVPSDKEQVNKHGDDMYTVRLRQNDGSLHEWPVFVSSWLGFGANEARRRQLDALINALPPNINYDKNGDGKGDLTDPCSPVGMQTDVEYNGKTYTVTGSGEYEGCLKTIYPLLLKHMPCAEEPCLFNGVHGPAMDFSKEKFVGVSEYWYTAHDVFKLTDEYNYEMFEKATEEFCKTPWETIKAKFDNHEYGEALTLELLQTSCFKASWIVNILHEGFDIPRLGVDESKSIEGKDEPIFKSVNNIQGNELSWTLGKMVIYASSQTEGADEVGVFPGPTVAEKHEKEKTSQTIVEIDDNVNSPFVTFGLFLMVTLVLYYGIIYKFGNLKNFFRKVQGYRKPQFLQEAYDLEEGRSLSHSQKSKELKSTLRTRSTMNLHELQSSNNGDEYNIQTNLPHSFTFTSFRDPNLHLPGNKKLFKNGNTSTPSLKSM